MSTFFASGGFTIDPEVFHLNHTDSISLEDAEAAVAPFVDEVVANLDVLDDSGWLAEWPYDSDLSSEGLLPESPETEDFGEKAGAIRNVRRHLAVGYKWAVEEDGTDASAHRIADTGLQYVVFGGYSNGDSPFEEFDAACFLADAAAIIPALREATGILGGGILVTRPEA
ncbi:hypothetical protein [Agromyces humi]|uniref:hypothetical protein n=1 Tax=Agromyces humi TaxID=1766800 RepID=UPI00135B1E75|nr:hypothetical protein [Agromyces humi]